MKVFILGAGASKGSQTSGISSDLEAPLSDDLFEPKYRKYADEIGIGFEEIERFRNELKNSKKSLEDWLTTYWKTTEKHTSARTKRANNYSLGKIHFYIWWMLQNISYKTFGPSNKYQQFVNKLRALSDQGEDFAVISFNYDTLLDMAFEDILGFDLSGSIDKYHSVGYIKPHGSVNWFLLTRGGDPQVMPEAITDVYHRYSIAAKTLYNGGNFFLKRSVILPPKHENLRRIEFIYSPNLEHAYGYPLIFLPLTVKKYTIVDGFEEKIKTAVADVISRADELVVIGYQAADSIIKEFLGSVKERTTLTVVGNGHADLVQQRIMKIAPKLLAGNAYNSGFAEYINGM
ncbi:MAG: hypothetical protein V1907_00085 [Candidatus Kerfeldbacteria bacterium]